MESKITKVRDRRLLLYNTLGSADEIQLSKVGPHGVFTGLGTNEYSPVKFGKGYRNTTALEGCSFNLPINLAKGCIECWVKTANYAPGSYPTSVYWGNQGISWAYPGIAFYYLAAGYYQLFFGTVGGKYVIYQPYQADVKDWITANQIMHYAVSWDFTSGVGTIADLSTCIRLYVNNKRVISSNADVFSGSPVYEDFMAVTANPLGVSTTTQVSETSADFIDNIKVWDYFKTDFSDKDTEDCTNQFGTSSDISIAQPKECIVLTDQDIEMGEGTLAIWVKNGGMLPTHRWLFNELDGSTVYDIGTGGMDGSIQGSCTVSQSGFGGACYYFLDDPAGGVVFNSKAMDNNGDTPFSISFYMRAENVATGFMAIMSKLSAIEPYSGWEVYLQSSVLKIQLIQHYLDDLIQVQSPLVLNSVWYHVVVTYDGSRSAAGIHMYFNGVKQQLTTVSDTFTGNATTPGYDFTIGARPNLTGAFLGYLRDIQCWQNYQLTENEIVLLYRNSKFLLSIEDVFLPVFNAPLDSPYPVAQGGTVLSSGASFSIDNDGPAFDFSGVEQWVDYGTDLCSLLGNSNKSLSFSLWFKSEGSGAMSGLISIGTSFADEGGQAGLYLVAGDEEYDALYLVMGVLTLATVVYLHEWYHVAATYDGTYVKLYLNGVLATEGTDEAHTLLNFSGLKTIVGGLYGTTQTFHGRMRDVRVYNDVLTVSQVRQIWNNSGFGVVIENKSTSRYGGLIIFNKLGSALEVGHSEVGTRGVAGSALTYTSGVFGNAALCNALNTEAVFPHVGYPWLQEEGCIELWLKPVGWSITNGQASSGTHYVFSTYHPSLGWFFELYIDTSGIWWKSFAYNVETGFNLPFTSPAFNIADGEFFHLAISWVYRGIDYSNRQLIFVNNVQIGYAIYPHQVYPYFPDIWVGGCKRAPETGYFDGVVDNLKVWNYAKTDFSDRLTEGTIHTNLCDHDIMDWKHVGVTWRYDGGYTTKKFFVSGLKVQTVVTEGQMAKPGLGSVIGADLALGNQGGINLNNIVVSKREFSEAEMLHLYQTPNIR